MCREAEETVQRLRALPAFTEELGLAHSSSYRSSASPWASHKLKQAHIQIHTYKHIFNIAITLFYEYACVCLVLTKARKRPIKFPGTGFTPL